MDWQGSGNTLYDTIKMDTYHFTFIQSHSMYDTKSEPCCKLWALVIMMSECRFIKCNKCITLVKDVDTGDTMHVYELGIYGKYLNHPLDSAVNLKVLLENSLKNKFFKKWSEPDFRIILWNMKNTYISNERGKSIFKTKSRASLVALR